MAWQVLGYALAAGMVESALFKNNFLWMLLVVLGEYLAVPPLPRRPS